MANGEYVEPIVTGEFRLAFPAVFEPKAAPGSDNAKYSITMLFDAKDPGIALLKALARAACVAKWGEEPSKWPKGLRPPFRNGEEVEWDGFAGKIFARASSRQRPGVVNARCQDVIDPEAVFGGLICRAQINAFAYDKAGNKGVAFGLNNLQILRDDGTRFSGRANARDVFEPVPESPGADDGFGPDSGSSSSGDIPF